MEFDDLYELNPSEALERIKELKNKEEYEGLTKEEMDEVNSLKVMLKDTVGDLSEDYMPY
ncbi:MAG: hypothetical protein JXB17_05710 [Bacteroidales bacterium]|nr:hypothetical protein [Bacteroidales bacterium]